MMFRYMYLRQFTAPQNQKSKNKRKKEKIINVNFQIQDKNIHYFNKTESKIYSSHSFGKAPNVPYSLILKEKSLK